MADPIPVREMLALQQEQHQQQHATCNTKSNSNSRDLAA